MKSVKPSLVAVAGTSHSPSTPSMTWSPPASGPRKMPQPPGNGPSPYSSRQTNSGGTRTRPCTNTTPLTVLLSAGLYNASSGSNAIDGCAAVITG